MALDPLVLGIVLLAALAHAGWNALVKASGGSRGGIFSVLLLTGGAFGLVAVALLPLPAREAWLFLFLSAIIHYGYYGFLLLAYRYGDLSHVYPVARGSAPLMVAAGAWVMAGEALGPAGMAGLALTSAGIMSLALENGPPRDHAAKALFFAIGTGMLIACYTVVDGLGVRASTGPISYIAWLNVLEAIPLTLWLLLRRPTSFTGLSAGAWRQGIMGGILATAAYGLVIFALSLGAMAHVSALRETSVLLAALIGTLVLRESGGNPGRRITAACLVSAGIVTLQLG
jgi:drug/metabolite transporter (DMT)-like permease